jgi:outer membrane protein assembly factor BamE (lipoprotein component of BamABCDE complex)
VKRPRFTLRLLLAFIAIVAFSCWWFTLPKAGTITAQQAKAITAGMTKDAVVAAIGEPIEAQKFTFDGISTWSYKIREPRGQAIRSKLVIRFESSGKVIEQVWLYPTYE